MEVIDKQAVIDRNLVKTVEGNHLESLKSLCQLLTREVNILSIFNKNFNENDGSQNDGGISLNQEVERFEANLIRTAMMRAKGNQTKAARFLGVKLSTLNTKIKRYGIDSHSVELSD